MTKTDNTPFSYMHSPLSFSEKDRWITHDPNENFAGEFTSEEEAKAACERWNTKEGAAVGVTWKASHEDANESDRGTFRITLRGTKWFVDVRSSWNTDEAAARVAMKLRDVIAQYGLAAVQASITATNLWLCPPRARAFIAWLDGQEKEV